MEDLQLQANAQQSSRTVIQKDKQPWRKPRLAFVPLHVTAANGGSGPDGLTQEPTPA